MRRWLLGGLAVGTVLGVGVVAGLVLTSGEAPEAREVTAPATGGAATLALSPVRSVVTARQRTATLSYTLGNDGDVARAYAISSTELSDLGEAEPDTASSAGRWVEPVHERVRVPAHEAVQAKVRLRVPATRGAGERRIGVTFTDVTPARDGAVGVRAQVTTSVYVEGSGPTVHAARLGHLELPLFSHGSVDVSATLVNNGTTTVVPGAPSQSVVGTLSRGAPFSLSGAVAAPRSRVSVSGRTGALPLACWCQIRVSTPDGRGGTTSATGRTLVLPWPQLGLALLALGTVVLVAVRRRRTVAPVAPVVPAAARRRVAAPSPAAGSRRQGRATAPPPARHSSRRATSREPAHAASGSRSRGSHCAD